MSRIAKWLIENGFTFKTVKLVGGNTGILVDTDYCGPYPTKECHDMQTKIFDKINRSKTLKAESRGFYTGVLITEK